MNFLTSRITAHPQKQLVAEDVPLDVAAQDDVGHILEIRAYKPAGTSHRRQFAMVLSATSWPVSLPCSCKAASHFSIRGNTSEFDVTRFEFMHSLRETLTPAFLPLPTP